MFIQVQHFHGNFTKKCKHFSHGAKILKNVFCPLFNLFFFLCVLGRMLCATLLALAASLTVSLARPNIHPLSSEMVNYINKLNTTWKVSLILFFLQNPVNVLLIHISTLQAGHNFRDVDFGYVKNLCGTLLKGPKLPIM